MRDSAVETVTTYLNEAQKRLYLEDVDEQDLEKVLHKVEKAKEELEKEIG